MNLRYKFLLIITAFLLLQGTTCLAYFFFVLNPKISNIERADAEKNSQRAKNLFTYEIQDLSNLTQQWAQDKALSLWFKPKTPASMEDSLKSEMREERIHLFYLIDDQLRIKLERNVDPKTQHPYRFTHFISNLATMKADFFKEDSASASFSGLYISERGPMILSVHSLSDNGKKVGWLIAGRYVTQPMLERYSFNLRTQLKIWPMGTSFLPEKMQTMVSLINANPDKVHNETTSNSLNSFSLVDDISGKHPVIVLSSTPRNIAMTIMETLRHFYAVILVGDFILVLLILKTLNHAIIQPMDKLIRFIKEVTKHVDAPPRLKPKHEDEFGLFSIALNDLIVEFCTYKNKIMSHTYRSGASKAKMEIVEDLSSSIETIVQLVENLDRRLWTLSLHELEKTLAEVKCARKEDFDLKGLQLKLSRDNEYIRYEVEAHRNQVRKIKEKILRTATLIRSYSHQIENTKPFSKIGQEKPLRRNLMEKDLL